MLNASHILPFVVALSTVVAGGFIVNHFFLNKKKDENNKSETSEKTAATRNTVAAALVTTTSGKSVSKNPKTLLDPNEKYLLPLVEKEEISHDTRRFRFGLPSPEHILGLPIGQHIHLIATINGEMVIRAYTPVSSDDDVGYVDLVIKVYKRNVHPKFPDGGKMTQYLDDMKIGDKIAFRGPSGKLQYIGNGNFSIKKLRKDPPIQIFANHINMIAGGSGITPMLQLVKEVLKQCAVDKTKLALLFANQSEDDILVRNDLEDLAKKHSEQFKLWYTLDRPTEGWTFSKGFISVDMIKEHLFPPTDKTITLMCGPPPMINFACQPSLEKLGYNVEMRFAY